MLELLLAALLGQQPAPPAASPALDYDYYKARVQPLFLEKREGHARCVTCHGGSTTLRLQRLPEGATGWTEEQTQKNFEAVKAMVVPGSPGASKLLRHPLSRDAGGDVFHGGGQHWTTKTDPDWKVLEAWVNGSTMAAHPSTTRRARIIQTNAAGDNIHVIDPATNKVVGVINDIEVPHGVTAAPDGTRLYFTNESRETVDVVDGSTFAIIARVPLSGRPNNIAVSKDGKRVYAGIAQAPGAVDVIDTVNLTRAKSIAVKGAIHNVYVTPDGKYVVSGSIANRMITVIDQATEEVAWELQMSSGIRPMDFEKAADGSTFAIIARVPLSGRPNNIAVSKDGKRVYAGIAQAPGAVDVIDTVNLTRAKSIAVKGAIHNVYVTPDGKYVVSGSIANRMITVIDQATEEIAWELQMSSGIRPMDFEKAADGSTARIFVQLSDYHGIAVVDFKQHKEVSRFETPAIAGETKHTEGLQGAPMHGFAITPDGKLLLATSKVYSTMYAYSLPDLKPVGHVHVGGHPEWVTLSPDGKQAYVAAAGDNAVTVVDTATLKEIARIPVGQVPKRNGTALLLP